MKQANLVHQSKTKMQSSRRTDASICFCLLDRKQLQTTYLLEKRHNQYKIPSNTALSQSYINLKLYPPPPVLCKSILHACISWPNMQGCSYLQNVRAAKRRAHRTTPASTMPAMSSLLLALLSASHFAPVAPVVVLYVCNGTGILSQFAS